jgi:lipoprotein-anchoring transpeptidase ErfK/SrfK
MVQFPYKSYTTSPGKKRSLIIYSLAGVLLIVVCLTAYSCTKKKGDAEVSNPVAATPTTPATTTAPAAPGAALAAATGATTASIPAPSTTVGTAGSPMPVPGPDVKTSAQATALITEANADIAQNKIIKARDSLNLALNMPLSAADQAAVKGTMGRLAESWLFGPTVLEGDTMCATYAIKSGDKFITIAKSHKTDYPVLMTINKIDKPASLRVGQNIKVINGPFRCVVNRTNYTLDLYVQNTFVRSFKVGLGKPGRETPAGTWEVTSDKSIKPKWTDPDTKKTYYGTDPDYPLGTRWIGLKGVDGAAKGRTGFALHGTNKPDELGTNISRGCIRLANPDIELLYSMLAPISTQVVVTD